MSRARGPKDYLELGDRLVRRGKLKTAAAVYTRCADAWLARTFLDRARDRVTTDPVEALQALAQAERLAGPSGEGRSLSARAYESLGQSEIARNFRLAVAD